MEWRLLFSAGFLVLLVASALPHPAFARTWRFRIALVTGLALVLVTTFVR